MIVKQNMNCNSDKRFDNETPLCKGMSNMRFHSVITENIEKTLLNVSPFLFSINKNMSKSSNPRVQFDDYQHKTIIPSLVNWNSTRK